MVVYVFHSSLLRLWVSVSLFILQDLFIPLCLDHLVLNVACSSSICSIGLNSLRLRLYMCFHPCFVCGSVSLSSFYRIYLFHYVWIILYCCMFIWYNVSYDGLEYQITIVALSILISKYWRLCDCLLSFLWYFICSFCWMSLFPG